jgi:hypothetical protein
MDSITDTILAARKAGTDRATVIKTLLASGHTVAQINAAFNTLEGGTPPVLPTPSAPTIANAPSAAAPSRTESSPVPPVEPSGTLPPPPAPPPKARRDTPFVRLALLIVAFLVLAGAGVAYAYVAGLGPFTHAPYTERDFLSGLLMRSRDIHSATYKLAFLLSVDPRDPDAEPFVPAVDPDGARAEAAYARDVERAKDANAILSALRLTRGAYPTSLASLSIRTAGADLKDPNGATYGYARTHGGSDFALTVAFETPEAREAVVRTYAYSPAAAPVSGQSVAFTKDAYGVYLSSTTPQPFYAELEALAKGIPPEMRADLTLGGTTSFGAERADWKFNVAGTGDFGDLTYAFDADLVNKDGTYYFRLNKFPSIFLFGFLDAAKGQWVKIDPSASSTEQAGAFVSLSHSEASYEEQREQLTTLLADMLTIAAEEKLFVFRDPPRKETVDGRSLYRYDLRVSKDALAPFTRRVLETAQSDTYTALAPYLGAVELAEDATSETERANAYAFYDENVRFTVWVDERGRPAIATYTLRIVPPDDAVRLAGKQVNVSMTLSLDGINEPVTVEAPEGAKPFEEAFRLEP